MSSVIPRWLRVLVQAILMLVVMPVFMVLVTLYAILPDNTFNAILSFAGIGAYVGFSWGGLIYVTVKLFRKRTGEVVQ